MNSDTGEEILNNLSDYWASSSSETVATYGYNYGVRSDDSGDDSDDTGITQASQPRGGYGVKQPAYRRRTLRRQKDDIRRFPAGVGPSSFASTPVSLNNSSNQVSRENTGAFMNLDGRQVGAFDDSLLKKPSTFRLSAYCRCERYDLDSLHDAIIAFASLYRVAKDKKPTDVSVKVDNPTPAFRPVMGVTLPQLDELSIPEDLFPANSNTINQVGSNTEGMTTQSKQESAISTPVKMSENMISSESSYASSSDHNRAATIKTSEAPVALENRGAHAMSEDFNGSASLDDADMSKAIVIPAPLTQPGAFIQELHDANGIRRSMSDFTRDYPNENSQAITGDIKAKLPVKDLHEESRQLHTTFETASHISNPRLFGARKKGRSSSDAGTDSEVPYPKLLGANNPELDVSTKPLPKLKDHELAHILGTVAAFGGEAIMLVPVFGNYSSGSSNSNPNSKMPGIGPPRVAFVFDYGCVCFFNYDQHEEQIILEMLAPFEIATRPRPNVYFKKERQLGLSSTLSQVGNSQSRSVLKLRESLANRVLYLANTPTFDNRSEASFKDEMREGFDELRSPTGALSTAISVITSGLGVAGNHALKWIYSEQRPIEAIETIDTKMHPGLSGSSWAAWLKINDFTSLEGDRSKIIMDSKEKYQSGLTPREVASGCEELRYCYSPTGKGFVAMNDTVSLKSKDPLEKLAVAFALAQAVKLNVFEARIEQVIQRNEKLSYSLARTGRPGLSKLEISKRIGEIFLERSDVNLHSDILGVPEFFWDEGVDYHDVYDSSVNFLEISKRVDLLNMRLDVLQELFDILNSLLDSSHMGKLNEVVILLLLMGCILTVFYEFVLKDLGGFLAKPLITRW